MDAKALTFQLYDHNAQRLVVDRRLPHWAQAGTVCFITWRTSDSIPTAVLEKWQRDRAQWLKGYGIDLENPAWDEQLKQLDHTTVRQFLDIYWNRWHDDLDCCLGACVLREPVFAEIVANSLRHFDGERYSLLDFVVMPNHVHVLVVFPDENSMLAQCESWKRYTATQINRRLNRRGRLWQQDAFDHLVRSEAQFEYLREYIAQNPKKAKLNIGEYIHYSRRLSSS